MSERCLKFAYRYGRLDVDEFNTIAAALAAAKHASDHSEESLLRIEQIVDGVVVGIYLSDDVYRLVPDTPHEPFKPRPYRLEISTTEDGKTVWADFERYETENKALVAWGVLAARYGETRVRVMAGKTSAPKLLIGGP